MTSRSSSTEPRRLALAAAAPDVARFFPLLQVGVAVRWPGGCPVDSFLRRELGAGPETIGMIQSVFLDGRPVDDIGTAVARDGSTLALSAALPGLVGATMRRGGAYAALRSTISHREAGDARGAPEGWVKVKLFNLLMGVLGPALLGREVLVGRAELLHVLAGLPPEFWLGRRCALLDGKPVEREELLDGLGPDGGPVLLSVGAAPPEG